MKIGPYTLTKGGGAEIQKKMNLAQRATRYIKLRFGLAGLSISNDENARFFTSEGYRKCPPVTGVSSAIARAASRVDWEICNEDGELVEVPLLNKSVNGTYGILQMPNPYETMAEFVAQAMTHDVLDGNIFIQKELISGSDKAGSMSVLPTDGMEIHGDKYLKSITGYSLDYYKETLIIPKSQVCHIKEPNPDWESITHALFGQSLFQSCRIPISTYNKSMEAGFWYLDNKGAGKLVYNKDPEFEMDLTPDAEDDDKSRKRGRYQGVENVGNNIDIIDGANLGVIDIASNPKEALVLEQRMQSAIEICGVIGFPPLLLGLKDATYQNAKEAKKAMWENCVLPRLDRLRDNLQDFIVNQFGEGYYLKYNTDNIDALQEDKLTQAQARREAYAGAYTVDEVRAANGDGPYPDPEFGKTTFQHFTQDGAGDEKNIPGKDNPKEDKKEETEETNK